jgi:hypothetical protein
MEFFETVMGHRFFEAQVPEFLRELKKLNDNLTALTFELRQSRALLAERPGVTIEPDASERRGRHGSAQGG